MGASSCRASVIARPRSSLPEGRHQPFPEVPSLGPCLLAKGSQPSSPPPRVEGLVSRSAELKMLFQSEDFLGIMRSSIGSHFQQTCFPTAGAS
ncbi:Hypothetical predicted protein [Marmota monax]|uniref:Uncharacterized protein n=1 Tax=Marmota monax TaxID=9995 RepID=A0A5E4CCS4_MARMO|nr:hypothetical protein GHT09_014703 [Marmota monax]VTJ79638.1 Hypothetical predicted protein [Marmota monax]